MTDEEKGLVAFDDLWRFEKQDVLKIGGKEVVIIARTIGASDSTKRDRYARSQARGYRRAVKNTTSDEYEETVAWIEESPDDDLIKYIKDYHEDFLAKEAVKKIYIQPDKDEKSPDGLVPILDKEEKDERQRKEVAEARKKWVNDQLDQYIKPMLESRESMEAKAREIAIEQTSMAIYLAAFGDATLLYGILDENREHLFEDYPVNVPQALKRVLQAMYYEVDAATYDPKF